MNTSFARIMTRGSGLLSTIYAHPFNQQLRQGILPRDTYTFYLQQDALYLREFSMVLKLLSERFTDRHYALQFRQLSNEMISSELNVHLKYLRGEKSPSFFSKQLPRLKKIPIISHYTEHLLHIVKTAPIEVSVASCIPCFWVYNNLGMNRGVSCSENNPYRDWIASYSSERFTTSTTLIIQTATQLTDSVCCPLLQEQIALSFLNSLRFEFLFFDAALTDQNTANNVSEVDALRLQK